MGISIQKVDGVVVIATDDETAKHIGHRLSVSSSESFSNYRSMHKLSGLHRHPLAENYNEALASALGDEEEEEEDC